ncbi:MAG: hypothetical protein ACK2UI_07020, partial [Anaerolineae bacterium]
MKMALKGRPVQTFARPDGLVEVEVCALSGELPGPDCPHRIIETFIAGTEPTTVCTMHQRIDGVVYTVLPPEAQSWAQEHHLPQPPSAYLSPTPLLRFTSPDAGAVYHIDPAQSRETQKIYISVAANVLFEHIKLYVDDLPLAHFASLPYTHLWRLEPGTHTFYAIGFTFDEMEIPSDVITIEVYE